MESVLASFRKGINSTLHLIFISAFSLLMHHLLPFDTYWEKKCYKTTISFFLRYNWQETFSLALWKEKNLRIRVTESIYFVFQKTGQRKWLFNQYKASQSERKTKNKKKKNHQKTVQRKLKGLLHSMHKGEESAFPRLCMSNCSASWRPPSESAGANMGRKGDKRCCGSLS